MADGLDVDHKVLFPNGTGYLIVQAERAIVIVLERIYEVDFNDTSYGFGPKRSCHQALAKLGQIITRQRVNWVLDADIKGFFDNVDFGKLLELLRSFQVRGDFKRFAAEIGLPQRLRTGQKASRKQLWGSPLRLERDVS